MIHPRLRIVVAVVLLVVLSPLAPVPSARADDAKDAHAYAAVNKSLYVWRLKVENRYIERLAAFCSRHGFTRVFLAIGSCQWDHANVYAKGQLPNEDRIAAAVAALKAVNCEVHGMYVLNDDPNDLQGPERITDLITATHSYNTRHRNAPITGLHGDQEPSKPEVYAAYMEMNRLAAKQRDKLGAQLQLGVTLKPLWLRQAWTAPEGGAARPFAQHILDVVDEASLMDYSDNPATVLSLGTTALQFAKAAGKKLAIAVETGTKGAAPEETWGQEIATDGPLPFFRHLGSFADAFARSHGETFDGIVVHDYFQYYALLYGTDPIEHEAIPAHLFGNSPADMITAESAPPAALTGFAGKLELTFARLDDGWAVAKIDRVRRENRDSRADNPRDAVDQWVALHAGGSDDESRALHANWLRSMAAGDSETVDVRVDGETGRLVIAELTSSQARAARRAAER